MQSIIKNNQLTAAINHHGAELCSLKNAEGVEFIWQADKAVWGRHSPVLFPIVGRLKNDTYSYMGKNYSLSQHGFARDKNFEVLSVSSNENEIGFTLKSDAETLTSYPFRFELTIIYKLNRNKLAIEYEIKNHDNILMPFSIGAHPGFCCPIRKDEKFEDYEIRFSENEKLENALLKDGLFSGEKKLLPERSDSIKLDSKTFINDALVFEDMKSTSITLQSIQSKHFVKLDFDGFPYLGIWSKPDAPFVCLEPWLGKADSVNHNGDILKKEGIQILEPHQSFKCSFNIEVH